MASTLDTPPTAGTPRSPLTGSANIELLNTYKVSDVVNAWHAQLQFDISDNFVGVSEFYRYQCNDTGLRFFHPRSIAGNARLYELLEPLPWYYRPEKWEHDLAERDLSACQRVLEVGCGEGSFVARLLRLGRDAKGVELNPTAVARGREAGLPLSMTDVADLAVERPGSYDAVCAFQVLEHVPEPKPFLESMIALLKVGGKLVIGVPNGSSFLQYAADNITDNPPHHMSQWPIRAFKSLQSLLPLKLLRIERESLPDYDALRYIIVQLKRLSQNEDYHFNVDRFSRRLFAPILRRAPFIRRFLTGHTLYVCFERTAA